ncbi:hypothetical protein [Bradyrhizobium sp. SZCCHNS1012]|uniref:hypothetical protein n=1 Tax=Bradyrhizobium sp. SZCCHNS1012 TaxID=3057297 RepID=UPI00291705C6|nr:hypothetical protein [Bradyrhizobium sp. SZCCHNS1012]
MQYAMDVRNAGLDARAATVGANAVLKIFDGVLPASCASADNGTVLSTIQLPNTWMNPAVNGSKSKAGTWQDNAADASGTPHYFRIYKADGVTCGIQGTCGLAAPSDMILDSVQFTAGQQFTVVTFTLNDNNG